MRTRQIDHATLAGAMDHVERDLRPHEYACYRLIKRACEAAGKEWTEDRFIEARCLSRLMLRAKLTQVERRYLDEVLPEFGVSGWRVPEDSHARARMGERLAARARVEDRLNEDDPSGELLARPADEEGWGRLIDRDLELARREGRT